MLIIKHLKILFSVQRQYLAQNAPNLISKSFCPLKTCNRSKKQNSMTVVENFPAGGTLSFLPGTSKNLSW
jgi:hypothetical protein